MSAVEFDNFADFYAKSEYSDFDQQLFNAGSFDLDILDVNQKAIESCDPALSEFPIVMCRGGGGAAEIDFGDGWQSKNLRPGFVDVQPANQECRFRIPDIELTILFVKKNKLEDCLSDTSFSIEDVIARSGEFDFNLYLAKLVSELALASKTNDQARNLVVDGLFLQIIAQLVSHNSSDSLLSAVNAIGDVRLARVVDYIESNISEPLCLQQLADVACMSLSHFARSFNKAMGRPAWAYVQYRRCCRAHDLLRNTKLPIIVIAAECGFSNQAYFTTVFKNEFGVTPGTLRQ